MTLCVPVPIGNVNHNALVSWATAGATTAGAMAILHAVAKHQLE